MEELNVKKYEEVEDIILELLMKHGVTLYRTYDNLDKDVVYVTGTINIVKLGDKPNTLKHQDHKGEWGKDVEVSDSYRYADYYRLDELNALCKNHLTGEGWT